MHWHHYTRGTLFEWVPLRFHENLITRTGYPVSPDAKDCQHHKQITFKDFKHFITKTCK